MADEASCKALIVTDLGFGDQGKGTMTDWLARTENAHLVVRHNGGSQAAHNVIAPDGRHHTFAQFGAAMFVPGMRTFLSRYMILSPGAMQVEAELLAANGVTDAFARTFISADALVITPYHIAVNRLREVGRGDGRHGSCGNGIGETMADSLTLGNAMPRAGDLRDPVTLRRKLNFLQRHKRAQYADLTRRLGHVPAAAQEIDVLMGEHTTERFIASLAPFLAQANLVEADWLERELRAPGTVVFEGAQGVLLDEWRGFHPYTTWSTCTNANAYALLKAAKYDGKITSIGVVRGYATRHGAGPFVTEDPGLTKLIPDAHNTDGAWQQGFRVGWFDAVATRYAIECCPHPIDVLAVTCMDRLQEVPDEWKICYGYALPKGADDAGTFIRRTGVGGSRIVLGQERDLSHQEALTDLLKVAKPNYFSYGRHSDASAADSVAAYLRLLEMHVGKPVAYVSEGPSANDKYER